MYFLIGVCVLILFVAFCYFFIKFKVRNILNKTGFDVNRALENLRAEKEAEKAAGKEDAAAVTQRRVEVKSEATIQAAPARRVITPVTKQ